MTVSIPESVTAEGNVKAVFVPVFANVDAPTVVETTAGVDISCFLMPDWDGPTANQNTGEKRRFCSRETFTSLGRVQWELAPLVYTYLPQELGTPGNEANAVYEALTEGVTGYLVIGYGIEPERDFAAGDIVDIFPVECGAQSKGVRGEDEFAPLTVTQTLGVSGPASLDKAIAA